MRCTKLSYFVAFKQVDKIENNYDVIRNVNFLNFLSPKYDMYSVWVSASVVENKPYQSVFNCRIYYFAKLE